jgi:hypothetical protein
MIGRSTALGMPEHGYDATVGARKRRLSTAMLLARKGYAVLVVGRVHSEGMGSARSADRDRVAPTSPRTGVVIEEGRVTGIRGHRKGESTITRACQGGRGAGGHHSLVARSVKPQQYNEKPASGQLLHLHERSADGRLATVRVRVDGRFEV